MLSCRRPCAMRMLCRLSEDANKPLPRPRQVLVEPPTWKLSCTSSPLLSTTTTHRPANPSPPHTHTHSLPPSRQTDSQPTSPHSTFFAAPLLPHPPSTTLSWTRQRCCGAQQCANTFSEIFAWWTSDSLRLIFSSWSMRRLLRPIVFQSKMPKRVGVWYTTTWQLPL